MSKLGIARFSPWRRVRVTYLNTTEGPRNRSHPRLEIDTKPVGDSVYVVEVCNDLSGVVDRSFGKPDAPQTLNVC